MIAIIAILAAILFPVFTQAKAAAKATACLSNMSQLGRAIDLYLADHDDQYPDRRDLKNSLGYKPWSTWPTSDPRTGWAAVVFSSYVKSNEVWSCPSVASSELGAAQQVEQSFGTGSSRYWMWRFDRPDDPVPLDNFWGKTPDQAVSDLAAANNPQAGKPEGVADVEMVVDPYFPKTIPTVPAELKGLTAHFGGRNRLFADGHAKRLRDSRTDR